MNVLSKKSEVILVTIVNIPLNNPYSSQIHYLSPGQPFYNLIAITNSLFQIIDPNYVKSLIERFMIPEIKQECESLTKIKKQPKLKANILYALAANMEVLGDINLSDCESTDKLNCINGAKTLLKVVNDFVKTHRKEFGSEYDRVCKALVESSFMVEVMAEQYYFIEKNYSQAVVKAEFAIEQYPKIKSTRISNPIVDLYADIAVSKLYLNEEDAALKAFGEAVSHFQVERSRNVGMTKRVMNMFDEFLRYYGEKNLLMLIKLVAIANELSIDDKEFQESLIELNNIAMPHVSGFFVQRIITLPDLLALAHACALDEKSGALLIKFKSADLLASLENLLRKTTQKFKLLSSADDPTEHFDFSIQFDSQKSAEGFLNLCRIAVRECSKPRPVRTKPTIAPMMRDNTDESASQDPYDYAENLSDEMGQQRAVRPILSRKNPQYSGKFFLDENSAKKMDELKLPEALPVAFKETGCQYSQNSDENVVAMHFQGNSDVYYGILNPNVLDRLPINLRSQIAEKFKEKIWERAAFEDCRQEMTKKFASTSRKDLRDWIFKIRILGHEFGDIRIYGMVIETVKNPNKPGHNCNLVAFTGFADDGHKNLPEYIEMPKHKKTSSSEEDDTCSMSDEAGDSRSRPSSPL